MESDGDLRDRAEAAERAAASPWIDYPKDPWWVAPGFGFWAVLFVLGVAQWDDDAWGLLGALPLLVATLGAGGYAAWQRRRRGITPGGRAPTEVNRVLWGFIVGAVVVAVGLFLLAELVPLTVALPVAFVVVAGAMVWYGTAYDRAAARARERLG